MSDYDFKKEDLIDARERFIVPKRIEPKIDRAISKIVGKNVLQSDPRLIKLVVKHKENKPLDSKTPDNFLKDPKFIEELKQVYG